MPASTIQHLPSSYMQYGTIPEYYMYLRILCMHDLRILQNSAFEIMHAENSEI